MANTNRSNLQDSFLQLVRLGIGTGTVNGSKLTVHGSDDWQALKALADEQGLSAIVLDGIDKLNTNLSNSTNTLPLQMKLEWIGEVLQSYEQRFDQYEQAISSLAEFYNSHGYQMMVLKGYSCSLTWPNPKHRPCGDIDIWQFGQQKEADAALAASFKFQDSGFKIDNSHHHHTVFMWQGFSVENHYDFINVHHHKKNGEIEKILKELAAVDSYYEKLSGEKVYIPSPNLHALFLLRHAMAHFASSGVSLRNILDWAFHVKAHSSEIDWQWLGDVLERYGMTRLYGIFNAICVGDLGFDVKLFPAFQFDPVLKERVLNEILFPAIPNDKPKKLLARVSWKIKRFKANKWKHQLVYRESMWSAFWSGVWGHLMKPSSI